MGSNKRCRDRTATPDVASAVRKSTRQSAKSNGYKLEPMRDKPTPRKKKQRKCKPVEDDGLVTPHTPVQVLQRMGRELEIPESELTEDKFTAHLQDKTKNVKDD